MKKLELPRPATEAEVARATRARRGFYDVRPRYTAGSPAMVDEKTALRVAEQEKADFERAKECVYGVDMFNRTKNAGLAGIVTWNVEVPKGWLVYDVLLASWSFRPFGVYHRIEKKKDVDAWNNWRGDLTSYVVYHRDTGEFLGKFIVQQQALACASKL